MKVKKKILESCTVPVLTYRFQTWATLKITPKCIQKYYFSQILNKNKHLSTLGSCIFIINWYVTLSESGELVLCHFRFTVHGCD